MINRLRLRAKQGTASSLCSPNFQSEAVVAAKGAGGGPHSSNSAQIGLIAVCDDGWHKTDRFD